MIKICRILQKIYNLLIIIMIFENNKFITYLYKLKILNCIIIYISNYEIYYRRIINLVYKKKAVNNSELQMEI